MSRQRTINDQGFWRSPRLQICTTEDKVALVHLLTCPDSNVVGAYSLVPKIACAEVGWSPDQWLQVIDRLRANDLTWYDAERMFVWVRIWWEHHHAGQSMGPKLRNRTLGDIRNIPHAWLQPFLDDFRPHLSPEYQRILDRELGLLGAADSLSISCRYGIDKVSNLSLSNPNPNPNPRAAGYPACGYLCYSGFAPGGCWVGTSAGAAIRQKCSRLTDGDQGSGTTIPVANKTASQPYCADPAPPRQARKQHAATHVGHPLA